ncbi:hypothetical protein CMV30_03755 [Nibricoccus aquaticus]|uniref:Uncharacterized protein n=1 Tax=Nibricoccus aquaticus TaxID=2576891 RepID=A0A290QFL6_9BACT|nr:hypothetical protein [Nibricoccus aquaticus]ATC63141.1 hypothetical protein CMV30_03755 [Nibricoccus aquaticus]
MRTLAQILIAEERRADRDSAPPSRAAFRVCEKLRAPLCTFAGAAGFRSLLSRALVLARVDAPLLAGVQIKADGTFLYSPEMEAQSASAEAAQAGAALVDQLLGLLITFIGEALTLRLVHDVWPQTALKDPKSTGK